MFEKLLRLLKLLKLFYKVKFKSDDFKDERDIKYGICNHCQRYNTDFAWCRSCDPKEIIKKFVSSGSDKIDELIKKSILDATWYKNYLEWIPYERLKDIKELGEG